MADTILEVKNIGKYYAGVKALDGVSLEFKQGEIHALAGENGAGKSTLIKILTGAIQPTFGEIVYMGTAYKSLTPQEAINMGISAVYQEFNSVPYLTVAENIFFGCEKTKGIFRDTKLMNEMTLELCKEMGVSINPKTMVKDLGVAYQQIVEILKAVSKNCKVLIMDEPSAPLTNNEIEYMFEIMQRLKAKGVTILYISHRLEEIFRMCDRVSVMRDGKYITTQNVKDIDRKQLVSYMVGRELVDDYPKAVVDAGDEILRVRNLNTPKLKNINFSLKQGEILGLGGLVGSGRTEIARAIFGADKAISSEITIKGKKVSIKSPKHALESGIGLIPEDRKGQGCILGMKISENISISILKRLSKYSFVNNKQENNICEKYKNDLRIKTPYLHQKVKNLSGGNQQKVVLAKFMATNCDILIFDEPTRGIDVGAKQEIYTIMRELTKQGKSIIVISSEMPELLGMSDRILVMHEGAISAEFYPGQYSQESILECASEYKGEYVYE